MRKSDVTFTVKVPYDLNEIHGQWILIFKSLLGTVPKLLEIIKEVQ